MPVRREAVHRLDEPQKPIAQLLGFTFSLSRHGLADVVRAANKYLGVLVAAKYARVLNEFPRDRSSSREKKLTTRSLEELSQGDIVYHVVPRRRTD